ncbi:MAG TPA: dehydrogenase [Verrucomicrobia bacterium]|nr:dehydrogenase [Verrucomicrobiota bacterium]
MFNRTQISIPTLVRVKNGAIDRVGIYMRRHAFMEVVLLFSDDLHESLLGRLEEGFRREGISILQRLPVKNASFEQAREIFPALPARTKAVIGFGGGKALDVAKYVSFLTRQPYIAVPTSLSNDGFCSPQSSLTLEGRRKSLPSTMPFGVVIDTGVCLEAPEILWLSGIGDLVSKITAVHDWKQAFEAKGTLVDDFAALLSDATVFQFIARPERTLEGVRLLGTALMLNGVAMEVCGSSRPASGSEHLISHALDSINDKPKLHGLQVGAATYLVSQLQKQNTDLIARLFDITGFWRAIEAQPFSRSRWIQALQMAPTIKQDFYTVLSSRDCVPEAEKILNTDPRLAKCFEA